MKELKPGDTVKTLDNIEAVVEWIKPRNEVEGFDLPKLIGNYVKLVGMGQLEYEWDLTWEGMPDDT